MSYYSNYTNGTTDDSVRQPTNTTTTNNNKVNTQSGGNRYVSMLPVHAMAELMNKLQSKTLAKDSTSNHTRSNSRSIKRIDTSITNPISVSPVIAPTNTTATSTSDTIMNTTVPVQPSDQTNNLNSSISNNSNDSSASHTTDNTATTTTTPTRKVPPPIPSHLLPQINTTPSQSNGTTSTPQSTGNTTVRSTPPPLPGSANSNTTPTNTANNNSDGNAIRTPPVTPPRLHNKSALSILTGKQSSVQSPPSSNTSNHNTSNDINSTGISNHSSTPPPIRPRRPAPVVQISDLFKQEHKHGTAVQHEHISMDQSIVDKHTNHSVHNDTSDHKQADATKHNNTMPTADGLIGTDRSTTATPDTCTSTSETNGVHIHDSTDGDSDSSLVHHVELVASADDDTSRILSRQQSDAVARGHANKQDNEIISILNKMSADEKKQEEQQASNQMQRPPPIPIDDNNTRDISTSSIYASSNVVDITRMSSVNSISDIDKTVDSARSTTLPVLSSTSSSVTIPSIPENSEIHEPALVQLHPGSTATPSLIDSLTVQQLYNKSPSALGTRHQSLTTLDQSSSASPLGGGSGSGARKLLAPSLKQHMLAKSAHVSPVIKERRLFTPNYNNINNNDTPQQIDEQLVASIPQRVQSTPTTPTNAANNTNTTHTAGLSGMKPPPLPGTISNDTQQSIAAAQPTSTTSLHTISTHPSQSIPITQNQSVDSHPPISADSTARHVRQSSNSNTRSMMQDTGSDISDYIDNFMLSSSIDTDNEFYKLVYDYKQQNSYVEETLYRIASLQSQIDKQADSMWSLHNVEKKEESTCRDGIKFQHTISAQTSIFDARQIDSLAQQLTKLRDLSISDISSHRFGAQTAQLNIELYINTLLNQSSGFDSHHNTQSRDNSIDMNDTVDCSDSRTSTTSIPDTPRGTSYRRISNDTLNKLKQCIDVLFHFEVVRDSKQQQLHILYQKLQQQLQSDNKKQHDVVEAVLLSERDEMFHFTHNIRKWCKICVSTLYEVGDIEQHKYVFCHMLRCRNITQWSNMLQFGIANNKCSQRDHINLDDTQPNWEFNSHFTRHIQQMLMLLLSTQSHHKLNYSVKLQQSYDMMRSPAGSEPRSISDHKSDTSSELKSDTTSSTSNIKLDHSSNGSGNSGSSNPSDSNDRLHIDTQSADRTDDDWILIDGSNEQLNSTVRLTESDFICLLQQFPLLPYLRHTFLPLFSSHIAQHHCDVLPQIDDQPLSDSIDSDEHDLQSDKQQLTDAVAQLQYIIQLCSAALRLCDKYQQVGRHIASLLISLPTLINECYSEATQSMKNNHSEPNQPNDDRIHPINNQQSRVVSYGTGLQPYACCESEFTNWWSIVSIQLDSCIIECMKAILHAPQIDARQCIVNVTYNLLSSVGAGQALIALMTSIHDTDNNVQQTQAPLLLPKWLTTDQHDTYSKLFIQQLSGSSSDNTHIIRAIVNLSSCNYIITSYIQPPIDNAGSMVDQIMHEYNTLYNSMYTIAAELRQTQHTYDYVPPWTDLPLIGVYELFTVGFIDKSTRTTHHQQCVTSIAQICNKHQICISLVLCMMYYYADLAGPILLDLLNKINLKSWQPTCTDMNLVQSLLATPVSSLSCQLGVNLMKSLDYTVIAQTDTSGQCIKPLNSKPKFGYIFSHSLLCLLCDVRAYHHTKSSSYIMPLTAFNKLPQIQFPALHHILQQNKDRLGKQSPGNTLQRAPSTGSIPLSPEHRRPLPLTNNMSSPSLSSRMSDSVNNMISTAQAAVGYNTTNALSDDFWLYILQRLYIRNMHGTVQFPVTHGYICQRWHKQSQQLMQLCTYKRHSTKLSKDKQKQLIEHDEYIKLICTDPILSYLQLLLTDIGTSLPIFLNDGWPMCSNLLRHPLYRVLGLRVLHDLLPTLIQQSYELSHLYMPLRQTQPPPAYHQSRTPSPNSRSVTLSNLQHSTSASQLMSNNDMLPQSSPRSLNDISPNRSRQLSSGAINISHIPLQSSSSIKQQKPVTPQLNQLGKALLQRIQSLAESDKPSGLKSLVSRTNDDACIAAELPSVAGTHIMSYNNDLHNSMLASSPYLLLDYWLHSIVTCGMVTSTGNWLRDYTCRVMIDKLICNVLTWTDLTSEPHTGTLLTFNTNSMIGVLNRFLYSVSRRDATPVSVQVLDDNDDSQVGNIPVPQLKPGQKPGTDPVKVDRHTAQSIIPPASLLTSIGETAYEDTIPIHTYLSFAILLQETRSDRHGWLTLGSYMSNWDCEYPTKQLFQKTNLGNKVIRHESMLRRWLIAALHCPIDHPLLPLYWQLAFKLWMSRVTPSQPVPHNTGGFYGFRLLTGHSGKELTLAVAGRLDELTDVLTQRRLDALHHTADPTTIHRSILNLPALFQAMTLWFRPGGIEPVPHATTVHAWLNELRLRCMNYGTPLNETYLPHRLAPLVCSVASQHIPLWWDLVDLSNMAYQTCVNSIHYIPTPVTHQPCNDTLIEWTQRHHDQVYRLCKATAVPPTLYSIDPVSRSSLNQCNAPHTNANINNLSVNLPQPILSSSDVLDLPDIILSPVWHMFDVSAQQCQYLAEVSKNFTERYQHRTALDNEYIELLPDLWRNEQTQLSVDKPCRQSITNNQSCTGMARFTFNFSAGVKQDNVLHTIKTNRDTAIQYSMIQSDYNDLVFVAQVSAISSAIKYITTKYTQPQLTEPKQQLYVNSGLAWLYALCSIDSEHIRGYKPVWKFLQHSVNLLAPIVTHQSVNSLQQQAQLLDVMSAHPHLVDQLYGAIDTSTAIQHTHNESYLLFYQHSLGIKTSLGLRSLKLLQQCNIEQWLDTQPSLEQQVFVLTHTFNAAADEDTCIRKLCGGNNKIDISTIDVATSTTSYFTNVTLMLLKYNFVQLVDTYVEHLLSCTLSIILLDDTDIQYKSSWLFTQWAGLANQNLAELSGIQWITTMRTMSDWLINVRDSVQQRTQQYTLHHQQSQKQYIIQLQQYQLLKKQHETFQSSSKLPPPPIQPVTQPGSSSPLYIQCYQAFDKLLQPLCKFMSVLCKSHILYIDPNNTNHSSVDANQYITINDTVEQKHEYWLSILQLYSALMPYSDSGNDVSSTPIIRHHSLTVLHSLCHVIKYYVGIDQLGWTSKLLEYYSDYIVRHSDVLFVSIFQHAVLATSFQPFQSILQNKVKSYATLLPFAQWCLTTHDINTMYTCIRSTLQSDDKSAQLSIIQQKRMKLVSLFLATLISIADFAYEMTQKQSSDYCMILLPLISALRIEIDINITALVQHMFNSLLFIQWSNVLSIESSTDQSDDTLIDSYLIRLGQCVNIIRRDILSVPTLQQRIKSDQTISAAHQLLPTVYDSVPYKLIQHYQLIITEQQKSILKLIHNECSTINTVANIVYIHRLISVSLMPQLNSIPSNRLQYTYGMRKCGLLVRWLVVPIRDDLPSASILPVHELTALINTLLHQLNTLYGDITAVIESKLITAILAELIGLGNIELSTSPQPNTKSNHTVQRQLPNELSDIISNLVQHKYTSLSLCVVSAITRTITNVDKLVIILETSIAQYMLRVQCQSAPHTVDAITINSSNWLTISQSLQIPDNMQVECIQRCVANSSMYTLHAAIRSILNNDINKQLNNQSNQNNTATDNTELYDGLGNLCGIYSNRAQLGTIDLLSIQQRIDSISELIDDIQIKSVNTPKHGGEDADDMDALKLMSIYRTIIQYQCAVLHCAGLPDITTTQHNNIQSNDTLTQLQSRSDVLFNRIIKQLYKLYSETRFNWSLVKALSSSRYSNKLRITCISIVSFIVCHCTAYCTAIKQYCEKQQQKDRHWLTLLDTNSNTASNSLSNNKQSNTINLQYYYSIPSTLQSCPQQFRTTVLQSLQSYTTNKQYTTINTEITRLIQLIESGTDHTRNISTVSQSYIPLHNTAQFIDSVISILYPQYTQWP